MNKIMNRHFREPFAARQLGYARAMRDALYVASACADSNPILLRYMRGSMRMAAVTAVGYARAEANVEATRKLYAAA